SVMRHEPEATVCAYTTLFRSGYGWYINLDNVAAIEDYGQSLRIMTSGGDVAHVRGGYQALKSYMDGIATHLTESEDERKALPSQDRKSTRLNSSHVKISYAVF